MSSPLSSTQFGAPGTQLPMFLTPEETAGLHANDFPGHSVSENRAMMDKEDANGMDYRHKAFRGSAGYLDAVKNLVEEEGGIHTPVQAILPNPNEVYGRERASLSDGHHRAVVAMETKRLLPVDWWGR